MPVDELVRGRVALSVRRHEPVGVVAAITPYNAALHHGVPEGRSPRCMAGNSVILRPEPAHADLVAGLRRRRRRRRPPAGRAQRRRRGGRRGRRAAHHPPRRRHGVVHRLHRGRAPDPRPGGADGEAGRRSSSAASRRRSTSPTPSTAPPLGADGGRGHDRRARRASPPPGCSCPRTARTRSLEAVSDDVRLASRSARPPTRRSLMGPVINAAARDRCERYVAAGRGARRQGRLRRRPAGRLRRGLLLRADRPRPARQRQPGRAATRSSARSSGSSATTTSTTPSRIANDSPYGLSAQVYGADVAAATAVARRLRTGAVNVNTVAVQRLRARRRLQAERPRPRAGPRGHPRVPGGQAHGDRRAASDTTSTSNLDWLISVDDHILEPPEPVGRPGARPRTATGRRTWRPRRRRRVLGLRRQALPELGPQRGRRQDEGGVQPRAAPLRRDAARLLRLEGPPRGHGPGRHPRLAVLPDDHPVLRAAVHGGQRPGVRLRVPADLQRLADRGVVRRGARVATSR